jgi:ribosomal protein S18 acetylase RimI-like enzyme
METQREFGVVIEDITDRWELPQFKWAMVTLERENFGPDAYNHADLFSELEQSIYITVGMWDIEERPVSFVAVERDYEGAVNIWTLAVESAHRNKKLGERMIRNILAKFSGETVRLMVREDNAAAIRLYEKCGFKVYGVWIDVYADGTDGLLMECPNA